MWSISAVTCVSKSQRFLLSIEYAVPVLFINWPIPDAEDSPVAASGLNPDSTLAIAQAIPI